MGVSLDELTIGIDRSKIKTYTENIKQEVITDTKTLLDNTSAIETSCTDNWAGKAQETFLKNFKGTKEKVNDALEKLRGVFEKEFTEIYEMWAAHDKNIIESI